MRESGVRNKADVSEAPAEAHATNKSPEKAPVPTETPTPDTPLHLSAQRDVLSLAALMAAALDISVPDTKWPSVTLSATAPTSSYSLTANSITIATRHLNNGFIYGEEVAHFLRTLMFPPPPSESAPPEERILYRATQELCGRMGRDFALKISEGSHLSALFEGTNQREGEQLLAFVAGSQEKIVGVLSQRERDALEFQKSASLFSGLLSTLDVSLNQEWQPSRTSLPGATALLKQRVTEISNSPYTPLSTQKRLGGLLEFLTPRNDLNHYEIEKVRDALRGCRDADEHRATIITIENSAAVPGFEDAEIHARAYLDAEAIMAKHPDTWPEHFKKIMRLSVDELKDPQGLLASLSEGGVQSSSHSSPS